MRERDDVQERQAPSRWSGGSPYNGGEGNAREARPITGTGMLRWVVVCFGGRTCGEPGWGMLRITEICADLWEISGEGKES